jgi:hypothetical protein
MSWQSTGGESGALEQLGGEQTAEEEPVLTQDKAQLFGGDTAVLNPLGF